MAKQRAGKQAVQSILESVTGSEPAEGLLQYVHGNGLDDLRNIRNVNKRKMLEELLDTVVRKGAGSKQEKETLRRKLTVILNNVGHQGRNPPMVEPGKELALYKGPRVKPGMELLKVAATKGTSSALPKAAGPNGILSSILGAIKGSAGKVAGGLGIVDVLAMIMGNMYLGQRQQGMDVDLQGKMLDINAGALNPQAMIAQRLAPYEEQRMQMAQQAMMNQLGGGQVATGESIIGG